MKAVLLTEVKAPLAVAECETPKAGPGQAVVRLKAAALNRRDYWITQGLYPGIRTPCVLGSDGAGVVESVGDEAKAAWIGREVILNPGLGWGPNDTAQAKDFHILGTPENGTFAERVLVPLENLHAKPGFLSWAEAAALPLAGVTAYRALFTQGQLSPGQTVLVTGIGGGVSAFAMLFALASGARVLVTSSSEEKLDKAKSLGATAGINYKADGWAKSLGANHGPVDLIIDSAGGPGYNDLLGLVKPGGRVVNYGSTAGPVPKLDMFKLFWKQLNLVGSTMGSPSDFAGMLELVNEQQIHPPVDHVAASLDEAPDLIASMAQSPQFGKLVMTIEV